MPRTIVHALVGLVSIHSKSGEIFARTSSMMDAGKVSTLRAYAKNWS
jgi:hypothetical protein